MSEQQQREVVLRVRARVDGLPDIEHLHASTVELGTAGKSAAGGVSQASNSVRSLETRARAASQSNDRYRETIQEVNAAIEDATNLFELLKLQYEDGEISTQEYAQALAELRRGLDDIDGDTTRLIRTKRALSREQRSLQTTSLGVAEGFEGTATHALSANSVMFNFQSMARGLNGDFLSLSASSAQFLRTLNRLQIQTGSTAGAFRMMLGVLGGHGGLLIVLGSLLPVAVMATQRVLSMFRDDADKTTDSIDSIVESMLDLIRANDRLRSLPSPFDLSELRSYGNTLNQLVSQRERLDELRQLRDREMARWMFLTDIFDEQAARMSPEMQDRRNEALELLREIANLEQSLGEWADVDIEGLEERYISVVTEIGIATRQLNTDTLSGLEATLKARLRLLQDAGDQELRENRQWAIEEMDQLAEYAGLELEHLSAHTSSRIEQIADALAENQDQEADDMRARLRMLDEFLQEVASRAARIERPVIEIAGPGDPEEDRPGLEPLGPPPAVPDDRERRQEAQEQRWMQTAMQWQQRIHQMEIDRRRRAGDEMIALEREQQAVLTDLKLDAARTGMLGTEQYTRMEEAIRADFADQQAHIEEQLANERMQNALIAADGVINIMMEMFSQSKALGSAMAIADGLVASIAALKNPPGPPWTYPVAGAVLLRSIQAARDIRNVQIGSSGGANSAGSDPMAGFRGLSGGSLPDHMRDQTNQITGAIDRSSESRPPLALPDTLKLVDSSGRMLTRMEYDRDKSGSDPYLVDKRKGRK